MQDNNETRLLNGRKNECPNIQSLKKTFKRSNIYNFDINQLFKNVLRFFVILKHLVIFFNFLMSFFIFFFKSSMSSSKFNLESMTWWKFFTPKYVFFTSSCSSTVGSIWMIALNIHYFEGDLWSSNPRGESAIFFRILRSVAFEVFKSYSMN